MDRGEGSGALLLVSLCLEEGEEGKHVCVHVCVILQPCHLQRSILPAVPVQESWGEAMRRKVEAALLNQISILLIKGLCCDWSNLQQEQCCVKVSI